MLRACVQVTERFRGNMPHVRSLEQCVHSRDERCLDQHLRDVINSRVTSSGTPALVADDIDTCMTSRDIRVSIVYVIKTSLTSLCTPTPTCVTSSGTPVCLGQHLARQCRLDGFPHINQIHRITPYSSARIPATCIIRNSPNY